MLQVGSSPGEDGIPKVRLLLANLVAGAVGGSAAAALTQPLDVVKTRAQLGHHGRSTTVLQVESPFNVSIAVSSNMLSTSV